MLRTAICCLFILLCFSSLVWGGEQDEFSLQSIDVNGSKDGDTGPLTTTFLSYYSGDADFTDKNVKNQHLQYLEADLQGRLVWCYNECYEEGSHILAGYNQVNLCWDENPFFTQDHFRTAYVGIGAFSKRLCDWWWLGQMKVFIDVEHADIEHYVFYDLILWGRYTYCDTIGIHVGFYALTGLRIDRVYPILGFDWQFLDSWKLNAVFPTNISLLYEWNDRWRVGGAARFLESRRRAGNDNPEPRGLFEYRSWGLEGLIAYECDPPVSASLFAGINLGGKLKIANSHWKDSQWYKFGSTSYAGAEFSWNF